MNSQIESVLREYQSAAVANLRASLGRGNRSPLLVAPCGSGKTITSSVIMKSAVAKRKRVLFLAPRRELVSQTVETLGRLGVEAGMIMAGERRSLIADVQVASVNTIHRRAVVGDMRPPQADLIVIDEAHASFSNMTRDVLALYPNTVRIGMTATPARSDGRGLGELYDDLILGPSVSDLTAMKYLVPVRYFAPSKADLDDVRVQGGEYHQGDLGKAMNKPKLVGDVVENWHRICPDRRTVVFAVNRAHAKALHEAFTESGVVSEYLDGKTPKDERAAILERIESGQTRVLCSVDVLTFGWDCPPASCAIIARPTKSIARYLQAAGRVLRPYEGKDDCILIDHSGVVEELGFLDDDQPWSLDGKEKIQERKESAEQKDPDPIKCPNCRALMEPAPKCPECGHDMARLSAKAIEAKEAELKEIRRKKEGMTTAEKSTFYGEILWLSREYGRSRGWAAHTFRSKTGVWPNAYQNQPAIEPSDATRNYVRSRDIAFAKRREAA